MADGLSRPQPQRRRGRVLDQHPGSLAHHPRGTLCKVRDAYLENLDNDSFPPETFANILSRYTLLAEAREKALASPYEML